MLVRRALLLGAIVAAASAAAFDAHHGAGRLMRLKGGSSWSESPAVLKLRELARNPYDLSAKDAVNPGSCLLYTSDAADE